MSINYFDGMQVVESLFIQGYKVKVKSRLPRRRQKPRRVKRHPVSVKGAQIVMVHGAMHMHPTTAAKLKAQFKTHNHQG